ncbi:TetR/AcrR family transcriptional regulator [Glycomyces tritici]|uniref:TetR/AcrR family transcriptional regulator C-terminal domain-containing protein n=1 Tax=Glycomyces tritici TaxID=2665176 RepID=A0ABT7YTX1_9ACTN|nr:TetR/AcrR family transcriptional regulator C-terminal domain-containing protein [Glycomyces tritici]MDN3242079.1 TetR/AcrR family transcriptional regulator C-terminal domain-containing protein [Glycomyces tritici]
MAEKATEDGPVTLWERLERPARTPRQRLSGARIAAKAVAIADEKGLCAVTMRTLAAELDAAPMAAYRFVDGKDDLFALMVNEVYAELDVPSGPWREVLREYAVQTRDMMHRHRWLAELPPHVTMTPTPNRLAAIDRALASLDGLGLGTEAMMTATRTVAAFVHGTVGDEVALADLQQVSRASSREEVREALGPQLQWMLATGRFPVYERYLYESGCAEEPRAHFDAGLELVLDGIAARIARATGPVDS